MPPRKPLRKQVFCDRWWKGQRDSGVETCIAFVAGWATQRRHKAQRPVVTEAFISSAEPSAIQVPTKKPKSCRCMLSELQACSTLHPVVWRLIKPVAHLPVSPVQIYTRLSLSGTFLSAWLLPWISSSIRLYNGSTQGPSGPVSCLWR